MEQQNAGQISCSVAEVALVSNEEGSSILMSFGVVGILSSWRRRRFRRCREFGRVWKRSGTVTVTMASVVERGCSVESICRSREALDELFNNRCERSEPIGRATTIYIFIYIGPATDNQ